MRMNSFFFNFIRGLSGLHVLVSCFLSYSFNCPVNGGLEDDVKTVFSGGAPLLLLGTKKTSFNKKQL